MDHKAKAKENFFKGEYKDALLNYSLALKDLPDDKEARIGAILADMAEESEEEAVALFEYYEFTKENDKENAEEIIQSIIDSVDFDLEQLSSVLREGITQKIDNENAISYTEFKEHIERRGSFKMAFEDIMFSTRVIIHKKDDFIDFLGKLIENGYTEVALSYLESALLVFPNDIKIKKIYEKINRKQ